MKRDEFEKEINLLDMFWAICLKWRCIFIVTILGVLFTGIYVYFDINKETTPSEQSEIELTDEEISETSKYLLFEESYENKKKYVLESPLMQLNPNGYYEGTLQYWIKTEGEIVDGMRTGLLESYQAALGTEAFYQKVEVCLEQEYSKGYYGEIVDVENLLVETKQEIQSFDNEKGIVTVYVRLMDKESVEKIQEVVRQELNDVSISVNNRFGNHELILIADKIGLVSSDVLATYQKENLNEVRDNYNIMIATEKELDENQRKYLESVKSKKEQVAENANTKGNEGVNVYLYVIKQMLYAGIIIVIVMVLFYALLYLLNGCIRIEDSVEHTYDMARVVRVQTKEKKKRFWLDRVIVKARHANIELIEEDVAADILASWIRMVCRKEGKTDILFSNHQENENAKYIVEAVKEKLCDDGIQIFLGASLIKDCKSIEQVGENCKVILVENAGESKYITIEKELQVCSVYGLPVLGMVIMS